MDPTPERLQQQQARMLTALPALEKGLEELGKPASGCGEDNHGDRNQQAAGSLPVRDCRHLT